MGGSLSSLQMHLFEVILNHHVMFSNVLNCDILNLTIIILLKLSLFVTCFVVNVRSFNFPFRILIHEVDLTCCMRTFMALRNKFGMCLRKRCFVCINSH
jgi:hypothetical protein